jgi:hypothetical protein
MGSEQGALKRVKLRAVDPEHSYTQSGGAEHSQTPSRSWAELDWPQQLPLSIVRLSVKTPQQSKTQSRGPLLESQTFISGPEPETYSA